MRRESRYMVDTKTQITGLLAEGRSLRIIVVNTITPPESEHDEAAWMQAERSRALRIGLLEAGYNIIAVFPADMHFPDRVAQLQPDMIIIDARFGFA